MEIKLIVLEGCDRCKKLKEKLSNIGVKYHFSTCDEDPENCDNLEALVGEIEYPMVLITNSNRDIFEVLFLTDSYDRLKEGPKNNGKILCVPNHSIDNIVVYVKNKLNLNK